MSVALPSEPLAHSPGASAVRWRTAGLWVVALACVLAAQAGAATWAWSTAGAFVMALIVVLAAQRGALDAGNPLIFFLAYFTLAMLLRGVGLLTFVDSPYLREFGGAHSARLQRLVGDVFLWCALGLVALAVGWSSAAGPRLARALLARVPSLAAPWRRSRVRPVVLGLIAAGFAGALLRVRSMGGLAATTTDLIGAGTSNALGKWWLIALTEFAIVGFHVWAVAHLMERRPGASGRVWLAGLAMAVPLYLVTSSKFLLIRLLFLPIVWRHFLVARVPASRFMLAFAAFGLLFPLFYAYRAVGLVGWDRMLDYLQATDAPWLKLYNRAYDADSFVLVLHRCGVDVPLQWGRTIADFLVFWVPRAWWPGKPSSFGLVFAEQYMPDFRFEVMTYMSPSLPGELWANFAAPGVIAGFWFLGLAMRTSWEAVRRGGPAMVLLHGFAFLTFMHLVEGSIAAQLANAVTNIVPLAIAAPLLAAHPTRTGAPAT